MTLEELESELRELRLQASAIESRISSTREQISEIKKSASEWKVGSSVTWQGKNWQVVGISFNGMEPVLRQFLKSGKLGVIPKRAWWFSEADKPVAAIAKAEGK